MDFSYSDERRMLADTLARFIADRIDPLSRSRLAETAPGYDPAVWSEFAELGAIGALFGEEHGGFGGSGFDIMVVFEALGRGLVPAPVLSALMSGRALAVAGRGEELEAVVTGAQVVAFTHDEADAGYDRAHVTTRAVRDGDGWVLNGAKSVVRDAEGAALLVSARTSGADDDPAGVSLFLVPADANGLTLSPYPCVDGGRAAEIALAGVALPASALVGDEGAGGALIGEALAAGTVALCAEGIGLMEVIRDATVEYLRTRVQFGEPIGRNQALQHRMATVLLEIEQARSAVINAAAALDRNGADRERVLSAAKYTVGKTGTFVAEEAIQLHGGIGMTWELAMTHFAKRLVLINHQLGDEDYHLTRFIALGRAD
ncbi:acyl-CoA dehydrogenase family protein [Novosphingobium sp. Gsoil 351]|uniref:acyl-CoA dehydrogenase family protein n=1 Tax=Novosphingobium sp. Gsoil 351 TaxID=2675225 RepID=UPI0012B4D6CA|nr:acyl-CoA dehydrogenase [Novosphingobium sp. Gsoil 351]QGN56173.1 pimeloyl-CoA dehydrogenase small subunit [Novosphingobium sp. Gsoil 351]